MKVRSFMKKYIFLLLCSSIFYAAEQNNETSIFEQHAKRARLYENNSPFQSISNIQNNRSYTPQKILGMAHFTYIPLHQNFTLQDKFFKNYKVQYLIKLLQDDFQTLAQCCDLNEDQNGFFGNNNSIDLQQTELLLDYEKYTVEIRRLGSNHEGICISQSNLFDLIQAWKESLVNKHPNLLLIESLDNEYELIAFYEKELMDEYLMNHPLKK